MLIKIAYLAAVTDYAERNPQFNGVELSDLRKIFTVCLCYVGETLYKYPERTRHLSQNYGCSKLKDT